VIPRNCSTACATQTSTRAVSVACSFDVWTPAISESLGGPGSQVLCDRECPSDVRAREHVINSTRPAARSSGRASSTSGSGQQFLGDHNLSSFRKQFHLGLEVFATPLCRRVSRHRQLSREHAGAGSAAVDSFPLVTNESAELTLESYVFQSGGRHRPPREAWVMFTPLPTPVDRDVAEKLDLCATQ
jgi:hypothetical protein